MYILAIETSCDETSIAILNNNIVLSNIVSSQIKYHAQFGGVIPEMASRMHFDNIFKVLELALEKANIDLKEINLITYTKNPGLIGALNIGITLAKTLSQILNIDLYPQNHLISHIYAASINNNIKYPSIGLIVSGGHTQIIKLINPIKYELLYDTLDDAAGECFDKVGRMLGVDYPAGHEISLLAKNGVSNYKMPIQKNDQNFSFSGLKSHCANLINNSKTKINKADFAFDLQNAIVDQLIYKLNIVLKKENYKQVIIGGGVSANILLRKKVENLSKKYNIEALIPNIEYCTDNAAMIGICTYQQIKYQKGEK